MWLSFGIPRYVRQSTLGMAYCHSVALGPRAQIGVASEVWAMTVAAVDSSGAAPVPSPWDKSNNARPTGGSVPCRAKRKAIDCRCPMSPRTSTLGLGAAVAFLETVPEGHCAQDRLSRYGERRDGRGCGLG